MGGDGEGEPQIHSRRIVLDRRVDELLDPCEMPRSRRIWSRSRCGACRESRRSGRCSPARSAPGEIPVPTSRSEPTRPRIRAEPTVGSVMRARIFSSVLLPAPLRPMMPTTSPWPTRNVTSRSAQIDSREGRPSFRPVQPAHRAGGTAPPRAIVKSPRETSCTSRAFPDPVPLSEIFDADRVESVRRRRQTSSPSAGSRTRLRRAGPATRRRRPRSSGPGRSWRSSSAQRKPSTTPTMGFSRRPSARAPKAGCSGRRSASRTSRTASGRGSCTSRRDTRRSRRTATARRPGR